MWSNTKKLKEKAFQFFSRLIFVNQMKWDYGLLGIVFNITKLEYRKFKILKLKSLVEGGIRKLPNL